LSLHLNLVLLQSLECQSIQKIGAVCSVQTPFPHTKRTYVHKIYPSLFPKHPKTRSHNLTKHGLQNPLNNKFSRFSPPLIIVPPRRLKNPRRVAGRRPTCAGSSRGLPKRSLHPKRSLASPQLTGQLPWTDGVVSLG
jgi:hypothetical protein